MRQTDFINFLAVSEVKAVKSLECGCVCIRKIANYQAGCGSSDKLNITTPFNGKRST